ncbi:MAG TPA: acetyl-CoA carboxylase biotin carboxylase subunit [Candidatus Polarisedimenticolia bacterium]|jgi:acetyl-CoA carboxylase biotin carboxylase subunit|nr:acetyl-CoA carboxylase biotin carboxylase subunit [Candidatus Polarisedimenticolia bacterium]
MPSRAAAPARKRSGRSLFHKVLVANRGEIAARVIRSCRRLGIATVAICSEVDRAALHARMADEVRHVGPAPPSQSYLDMEAILAAARESGAQAVHPGYGFLSENPEFAEACRREGLVFIGPGPASMRKLGNKIEARRRMAAAGVPVVPGLEKKDLDEKELARWAAKNGYPILLKAAAGGGGRGMRVIRSPAELGPGLASARGEARTAFGDDTIFAERYLEKCRHIEVQVLVDSYGKGISLGERECSLQRRHQKLLEETPSPVVDGTIRRKLGRWALAACEAAGYANAGTVEFLRDEDGHFYFLEINARLQVEHPVTEMVMGLDLVEAQIRIAAGEPLPVAAETLQPRGWAMECRIQAEDPADGFRPSPGRIHLYRPPEGPRVRVDSGVAEGDEVSLFYDSLLAKLIVSGRDREAAIGTMATALAEFRIGGVATTLPFHRRVMSDPDFRAGVIDTGFVDRFLATKEPELDEETEAAALVAAAHLHQRGSRRQATTPRNASAWTLAGRQAQQRRGGPQSSWGEP